MGKSRVVMVAVSLAGALLLGAAPTTQSAEDPLAHHVGVDLAVKKTDVMAKAMLMDQAQRDAFWPVYAAYQREQALFSKEAESLLNAYLKDAASIDDARAKVVLAKALEMQEKRVGLLRKYAEELAKKLPDTLVLEFVQVELRMQHLADLQISGKFPDVR